MSEVEDVISLLKTRIESGKLLLCRGRKIEAQHDLLESGGLKTYKIITVVCEKNRTLAIYSQKTKHREKNIPIALVRCKWIQFALFDG